MRKVWMSISVGAIVVLLAGAEVHAAHHQSTGMVVRVNPAKGTVMLLEKGQHFTLTVGSGTLLLDDQGQRLGRLTDLQVGDYIREECEVQGGGTSLARKIAVLSPFWRVLDLPEEEE